MHLAYIPSPSQGVWHLGPLPIRAYALSIIAGIAVAVWIGERRWVARGGQPGTVMDVGVWAVLFGLVGGRLYHVVTDPELYFGSGRHPLEAFAIWKGGLGIWGAISLGGVGAWIGCRRAGIKLPPFADAVAPGIAVAQAIGRWGNYFNQELFGRPTTLPWGVKIDPSREGTVAGAVAYQPTFLYESLWDLGVAGLVVLADRRFRFGRGRAFALYVMAYTAGRFWIESLRIDPAHHVLGLRLNLWTSVLVFAGALVYFLLHGGPRETEVQPVPAEAAAEGEVETAGEETAADGADEKAADEKAADEKAADEKAAADDGAEEPAEPDAAEVGAAEVGAAEVGAGAVGAAEEPAEEGAEVVAKEKAAKGAEPAEAGGRDA